MNIIKIFENNEINPIFVKANNFLYNKFKEDFDKSQDKNKVLSDLWTLTFKATLTQSQDNKFQEICFENKSDLTLFLFKFN